jgi:hypothetical protein
MHYVSRKSIQMQEHKLHVACPSALIMVSTPGPSSVKNSVLMFHAPNALCDPQIASVAKVQVQREVSQHASCGSHTEPTSK